MATCIACGREAPPDFKAIEDRPVVYCHECFAKGGHETAAIQPVVNLFFPPRPAPDSPQQPTPGDRIAGPADLVATGQMGKDGARRVLLFRGGTEISDHWVKSGEVSGIAARLGARRGECDAMFATAWSHVWTVDGPPFRLWDREGALVTQEGELFRFRSGDSCRPGDIAEIHGYLEDAWVVRGVRCVLQSGAHVRVAEEKEAFAAIDPTYDGIDVSFDAAWVVSLARALGQALGVPVRCDEPL